MYGCNTITHVPIRCNVIDHSPLNTHKEKPLAIYAFTSNSAEKEKITVHTSSGGVIFNDIMVQFAGEYTHTHTRTHTYTHI